MLLDADESQLLLIDYQEKLMPVIHGGAEVVANAVRLGRIAQLLQVPRPQEVRDVAHGLGGEVPDGLR